MNADLEHRAPSCMNMHMHAYGVDPTNLFVSAFNFYDIFRAWFACVLGVQKKKGARKVP